jgi:peptide/nickel transport system substrate-binding protein
VALALVVFMTTALAGCGEGKKATGSGDDEALVIGVSGSIGSLDVNQEAGILNYYLGALVNEGLVSINNEGQVIPALAESWKDDHATVWTFKLRKDAKFSDGSAVTADDIVWSIERAMDPEQSPGVAIYFPDYVNKVEKTAEDEITITLEGSHAGFIWAVSNVGGLFVTKEEWAKSVDSIGSPKDLLLGSGPYKVTEFEPASHVTFEKSDTWWGENDATSKIRVDFFSDEDAKLLAFTEGEIDFALNIPVDLGVQWEKVEGAKVEYISDRSYYGITFDVTVAPFNDEHVRKAVSYAIDAQSIIEGSILKGHGEVATAITPPEQFISVLAPDNAREQLSEITHYAFDIEKAKEELGKSTVPNGFETTVYYPSGYPAVGNASLIIADELKNLGITLNVKEIPLDQWLNEVGNGEQGIAWMVYLPTTAEPGEIAAWLLDGTGPGYNPANWTNEQAASLVQDILSAPSLNAELAPTLEANEIAQQQAIYAPVWWGEAAIAYQADISVKDYNSFSLTSQNWPAMFSVSK